MTAKLPAKTTSKKDTKEVKKDKPVQNAKSTQDTKVNKPVGIGAKAAKGVNKPEAQKEMAVKTEEKKEVKPVEKNTAKLPTAKAVAPKTAAPKPSFKAPSAPPPTTASSRIGKLKDVVKRAMTDSIEEEVSSKEPEKEEVVPEKVEVSTTFLPSAMAKKAPLPPKKPVQQTPSGKLSLSDALQASQQATQTAPLFDAAKFLKK